MSTWHQTGWNNGGLDFSPPGQPTHTFPHWQHSQQVWFPFSPSPEWISLAWWMPSQMAPPVAAASLFSGPAAVPQQPFCRAQTEFHFCLFMKKVKSLTDFFFKWTKPQMSHEFFCKMKCLMNWRHFLWSTLSSANWWKHLNLEIQIDFYCVFEESSFISVQHICCWFFGEKILLGKKIK